MLGELKMSRDLPKGAHLELQLSRLADAKLQYEVCISGSRQNGQKWGFSADLSPGGGKHYSLMHE